MARRLPHRDEIFLRAGGEREAPRELVAIELLAGELLERRDDVAFELRGHVLAHLGRDAPLGLVGHVEHHDGAVVFLLQDLEPLHEREAARVREEQEIRRRELGAGRADVAALEHADVALDVGAHVLRVTGLLGLGDVAGRALPHAALEGVDLRQHREEIERPEQLGDVAGHERVDDLAAVPLRARELLEVLGNHPLLRLLALVFRLGLAHHAAPQSFTPSLNAPACSRITLNWPMFSENLKLVCGTPALRSAASSIG